MKLHLLLLLVALSTGLLAPNAALSQTSVEGDYVTESYPERGNGLDWVAVTISSVTETSAHMQVRSRTDKKKATCTYDAELTRRGDGVFTANIEGPATMVVKIEDNVLYISTKNEDNSIRLMYYCSGGGTMEGAYLKLNEPLDTSQFKDRK